MHRHLVIILPEEWGLCVACHGTETIGMFTVACPKIIVTSSRFFFCFYLILYILNLSNLDIWKNFLTVILTCWWLLPAGYHPHVCKVISFVRSTGCFLFSLLSMFMVLYVSAASRFRCVAILDFYFSEYLLISSLTVGIPRSLRISSFLTYHGAFTIVLRILACIISILFIWLIVAVPHSGIPYVQIGFMIVLYIFNLFSMLNLDFRLVSQCICLLVFCIFSTIDLVCSFHVSCVSKCPRYLTCFVCVICVPFRRMFGGIFLRSVNVIWLHLLGFAFICFSCSHFSIFQFAVECRSVQTCL